MSCTVAQIKQLVSANRIPEAIECLTQLCAQTHQADTAILLSAQYNSNERENKLGILSHDDYSRQRNRIINALLSTADSCNEQKNYGQATESSPQNNATISGNGNVVIQGLNQSNIQFNNGVVSGKPEAETTKNPNGRKTIFISYATANRDKVEKIRVALEANYEVIIDFRSFDISDRFEDSISEAIDRSDATLFVISSESLRSHWVATENVAGMLLKKVKQRKFFAVYLDNNFLNHRFVLDTIKTEIQPKITELDEIMAEQRSLGMSISNLQNDLNRLDKLKQNLPDVVGFLREQLCIDLSASGDAFDQQIEALVRMLRRAI